MSSYQLDNIDQKILSFLVKNARMPFLEIARECNVSGAAIHQRVKRLETNGVITGSRILVKPQALGLNVCAFVSVSLSEANKYPEVIEAFKNISEVVECHFVTGKHNLLIKIYCFDHDHLMQILLNTIQKIPYVQQTETQISLDQAIERQVWVKEYQNTSFSASVKKNRSGLPVPILPYSPPQWHRPELPPESVPGSPICWPGSHVADDDPLLHIYYRSCL